MAKGMCYCGLVVSGLVFLVFVTDMSAYMAGMSGLAPFKGANILMDSVFVGCAAGLAYLSWSTLKEQV